MSRTRTTFGKQLRIIRKLVTLGVSTVKFNGAELVEVTFVAGHVNMESKQPLTEKLDTVTNDVIADLEAAGATRSQALDLLSNQDLKDKYWSG